MSFFQAIYRMTGLCFICLGNRRLRDPETGELVVHCPCCTQPAAGARA